MTNEIAYPLVLFPLVFSVLVFRKVSIVSHSTGKNPFVVFREGTLEEKLRVLGLFFWSFIHIACGVFLLRGWKQNLILEPSTILLLIGVLFWLIGCVLYQASATAMGVAYRIGVDRRQKALLVDRGVYHYIRHPIYSAVFVLLLGSFLVFPHLFFLVSLFIGAVGLRRQALLEERFLEAAFGEKFLNYKKQTGRFLPKIFCR